MSEYTIITDPVAILAGTTIQTSTAYINEAKSLDSSTPKALGRLKSFITAMENIAGKEGVKDSRISNSGGNIEKFSGYENIKTAIGFLNRNLSGLPLMKNLINLHSILNSNKTEYMDAYSKRNRLVILEYESALYMLVTGLSFAIANYIDVKQTGTKILIVKKSGTHHGIIEKTIADMSVKFGARGHKEYLQHILRSKHTAMEKDSEEKSKSKDDTNNIKESYYEETVRAASDTFNLLVDLYDGVKTIGKFTINTFKIIVKTVFGIIPLIRVALYLKYKKKADTIMSLEQQISFIQMNIEQLDNMKTMDPKKKEVIIKKQEAVIEAYRKKAEKLRAELTEGERDAAVAIKEDDGNIKTSSDDDYVLETTNDQLSKEYIDTLTQDEVITEEGDNDE